MSHSEPQWPYSPSRKFVAQAYGNAQQFNVAAGTMNITVGGPRPSVSPMTLMAPPEMVGRGAEIDALLSNMDASRQRGNPAPVSVISGMPGVGKTALARAAAKQLVRDYPDACLEVDLYGFTPGQDPRDPKKILAELLRLVGIGTAEMPSSLAGRAELWRAWLAKQRVLLVLDNALNEEYVIPLLPPTTAQCVTIITSRSELKGVDAAIRLSLDVLPEIEAAQLLSLHSNRKFDDSAELMEVAKLCGCLPLALRSIGSLLTELDAGDVAILLSDRKDRFHHLPEIDSAVRAAFEVSYLHLNTSTQKLMRACAWHPGPDMDAFSVAALVASPLPVVMLEMDRLHSRGMLVRSSHGRSAFHDLFRSHAERKANLEDSGEEIRQGQWRLIHHLYVAAERAIEIILGCEVRPSGGAFTFPDLNSPTRAADWLRSAFDELHSTGGLARFLEDGKAPLESSTAFRLSRPIDLLLMVDAGHREHALKFHAFLCTTRQFGEQ
ncbi:NB-ARC domain-containing protein [Streptosporangium subroseum]|uniref:NB-ARC domain-containing protein n=1 Tax=Streptosporangium subroseum TaxID=106412 RepID=UPI00343B0D79